MRNYVIMTTAGLVACLTAGGWSGAVSSLSRPAARPHLQVTADPADTLLAKIRAMKQPVPHWTGDAEKDRAVHAQWLKDLGEYGKQASALIWEFYEKYPARPEVADLLAARWQTMAGADMTATQEGVAAQGIAEAEKVLAARPTAPLAKSASYWLAAFRIVRDLRQGLGPDKVVGEYEKFARTNPGDPLGANLLYNFAPFWLEDLGKQHVLYARLVADFPNHRSISRFKGALRRSEAIGQPMNLSFTDAISGKPMTMADFKGKVVLLDFWATWCPPCVAQHPALKSLYARFHEKGLEVIGIDFDSPESAGGRTAMMDYVKKNDLPWPEFYLGDAFQNSFAVDWGVALIPQLFLIDRQGRIRAIAINDAVEERVMKLLKE